MALTREELLDLWQKERDFAERDKLLEQMMARGLFPEGRPDVFPQEYENRLEEEGGLYPDVDDPQFLAKLLRKTEFAEDKQQTLLQQIEEGETNPCDPNQEFERSPVQRFISQFLSPKTPYNSALLYHGVGVGKTCSAISVAEAYLELFPTKQVIIVAPPNIQPGFDRTIFNMDTLKLGSRDGEANTAKGCTGNSYLKLTGTEFSRDEKGIATRITRMKSKRYQLFGYLQFYNHIRDILDRSVNKSIKGERRTQEEMKVLARKFSGRLIIIDEAHNLRDISGETEEENVDAPGGLQELTESKAGKKLTPYLRMILEASTGLKLLLLTATPMYNSYREIIFLLNLLLLNDKRATLREDVIFKKDGSFTSSGETILGRVASAYLSFMRGENPLSFPIRLQPEGVARITEWPHRSPTGSVIPDTERAQIKNLPFVECPFQGDSLALYSRLAQSTISTSGLGLQTVDTMIQAGNWIFPGSEDITRRIREEGFRNTFEEVPPVALKSFKVRAGISPQWLREDQLATYSPKAAFLIKRLRTTKGVSFVYSRFVKSGALTLAMALEANGYTLAEREKPFLVDGNQMAEQGRQCALCEKKEKLHAGADHAFAPAYYVLLTGRDEYTPHNKEAIDKARSDGNFNGKLVKVVVGSQVASEGIDLRFIREAFVFDSWYHLNKLEQVIGRAIRMCSHALLDKLDRNCTINLMVTAFPKELDQETLDMYQYRMGFLKAVQVGKVTRVLKKYAVDCNLNRDAVLIQGLPAVEQRDGQGVLRKNVNINDMPFTSVCDWIETCDYECGIPVKVDPLRTNDSTYDEYAGRWRENKIKESLRKLFSERTMVRFEDLKNILVEVPRVALAAILADIVGNKSFRIRVGNQDGYILYKNGLYLFQPDVLKNTRIPLALRAASFPVKRDSYEPIPVEVTKVEPTVVKANEEITNIFWNLCMDWVKTIQDGTATTTIPIPIKETIRNKFGEERDREHIKKLLEMLEMIPWFYETIQSNEAWRSSFAQIVAEMLWDEFFTVPEQYSLYQFSLQGKVTIPDHILKEHIVRTGSEVAYRMIDTTTAKLQYMCKGAPCIPSLIPLFESRESDPLFGLQANVATAAPIYGTYNVKTGNFIFKTNNPVAVGKKPGAGKACAIVSAVKPHIETLETIGEYARTTIGSNFNLTKVSLSTGKRAVNGQNKPCALTDVVLRFMDKMNVSGKRWFYRPIATIKTNHPAKLPK